VRSEHADAVANWRASWEHFWESWDWREWRLELGLAAAGVVFLIADFVLFGLLGGLVVLLVALVLLACGVMAYILLRDALR
jgi:hypothetical protein